MKLFLHQTNFGLSVGLHWNNMWLIQHVVIQYHDKNRPDICGYIELILIIMQTFAGISRKHHPSLVRKWRIACEYCTVSRPVRVSLYITADRMSHSCVQSERILPDPHRQEPSRNHEAQHQPANTSLGKYNPFQIPSRQQVDR